MNHPPTQPTRLRVLVILGEGGHTVEMIRLVDLLGPKYEYAYMVVKEEQLSEQKIRIPGPVYRCNRPQWKVEPTWKVVLRYLRLTWQSLWIVLRVRPHVVMHSGPGLAVPAALLAKKLLGAHIIYVENGARVRHPSRTGRWMYGRADLFFVQWPELQEHVFPDAIFAGLLHG